MKHPGLYIHIPFCLRKCGHCDFYSVTSVSRILISWKRFWEMEMVRDKWPPVDTVYLGAEHPLF